MTMPNFQPESEVGLSDRVVHANFERKFKGRPWKPVGNSRQRPNGLSERRLAPGRTFEPKKIA